VATDVVRRGQTLTADLVESVEWPEDLVPQGTFSDPAEIVGRVAVASIMAREPFFQGKVSQQGRQGFAASLIKEGMRAYTIQTSGPAASVAGLVRPGDHVDVLLTLKRNASDDLNEASTTTLMQLLNVLAVDQIFDPDAQSSSSLNSSRSIASVTLMVSPEQASVLSLAQHHGDLSLSLRSLDDTTTADVDPATIQKIRRHQGTLTASRSAVQTPTLGVDSAGEDLADSSTGGTQPPPGPPAELIQFEPRPPSYIQTYRGSSVGRVAVYQRH
jgi:Flp pilus assembly protein CpaB